MTRQLIQKPTLLGWLLLRLKYRCYVSFQAKVFKPEKIVLSEDVVINRDVFLNYNCYPDAPEVAVWIGKNSKIMPHVFIQPIESQIVVGENCTVHPFSVLIGGTGGKGIDIGNSVRIAVGCTIVASSHVHEKTDIEIYKQGILSQGIKIDDDVWIGANVTILDGVTIGKGSIIGAGSVVTKSIPEYSVAHGVPAKVCKNRKKS